MNYIGKHVTGLYRPHKVGTATTTQILKNSTIDSHPLNIGHQPGWVSSKKQKLKLIYMGSYTYVYYIECLTSPQNYKTKINKAKYAKTQYRVIQAYCKWEQLQQQRKNLISNRLITRRPEVRFCLQTNTP